MVRPPGGPGSAVRGTPLRTRADDRPPPASPPRRPDPRPSAACSRRRPCSSPRARRSRSSLPAARRRRRRRAPADDPVRGGRRPRRRPDRLQAGERVSVGFKPRGSDRWTVGGGRAQALPAGRLSGHALRDQRKAAPGRAGCGGRGRDARIGRPRGRSRRRAVRRAGLRAPGRPRRRRRPGRPQARGVRLPAVLGADRQLDAARLGEALDHRLLRRRRGRQRRPPAPQRGRLDHRRLERLDELEADRRHQCRARQRDPGRADRAELRLVVRRGDAPEGAARQRRARAPTSPARSRPPSAIAARTGSTSISSRSCRPMPTSSPRWSSPSAPSSTRSTRATRSRSTPPAGSATTRSRRRPPIGRRGRRRDHGLRLSDRLDEARSARSPRSAGPTFDVGDTVRAYLARLPASKIILGGAVLRPCLVDRLVGCSTRRTSRAPRTAPR